MFEKMKELFLERLNTWSYDEREMGVKIETDMIYDPEEDKLIITISDGHVSDVWIEERFLWEVVRNHSITVFNDLETNWNKFVEKQKQYAVEQYFKNFK